MKVMPGGCGARSSSHEGYHRRPMSKEQLRPRTGSASGLRLVDRRNVACLPSGRVDDRPVSVLQGGGRSFVKGCFSENSAVRMEYGPHFISREASLPISVKTGRTKQRVTDARWIEEPRYELLPGLPP